MATALEFRQEAGRYVKEARDVIKRAETEKRELTAEENERVDKLNDDAEARITLAGRIERQERNEAGFGESDGDGREVETPEGSAEEPEEQRKAMEMRAFSALLRGGPTRVPKELRSHLHPAQPNHEQRTVLQMDSDVGGGFFDVPETFVAGILKSADNLLPIRQFATKFQVGRNGSLGQVSLDADISDFTYAGEVAAATEDTGITFGKRELNPHDLNRKLVKISKKLIANPKIDIVGFVTGRVTYALNNTCDKKFNTGTGARQPLGLFIASDDGIGTARDVATGDATGLTADGLFDVQDTLNDAYDPNARWYFHKDAITKIRKLKDGDGQYLWQPGLQTGTSNVILGKPYMTSANVPNTFTNGLYVGMYGDFSYYYIVDATTMTVQVLLEKYAETGQIGLLFDEMANDAMPVLAEAFVRIKCSA